jgi:glycosyltransferase involved in cell wall biosynthesis
VRRGVVIPVHGHAPYLAEAVESVLAEGPDDVVLVDDASPHPVAHPDVRVLRLERNEGPGSARAHGAAALRGCDVIATCDADDAWAPGSLAPRVQAIADGAGWSFGRAYVVGPDGRPTGERWPEVPPGFHEAAALGRRLYAQNPIPVSSAVVAAEWLDRAGGFSRGMGAAEDWDLWLRLCAAGAPATSVPEAVVRYRRHAGAMTADITAMARGQRLVHERHAHLVDEGTARAALDADRLALANGLARDGHPLRALATARALRPVLQGLRRRDPYRAA